MNNCGCCRIIFFRIEGLLSGCMENKSMSDKVDMNSVTILADGDYPTHPVPLAALRDSTRIVCCDGAFAAVPCADKSRVAAVVGDGDSIPEVLREQYANLFVRVSDQETNDLTKAVRYAVAKGWSRITIVGATGKREDHTLGNIGLLADYASFCDVVMLTDYGRFVVVSDSAVLECFPRQQVSIFSLTPHIPVSVKGLEYPIKNRCLNRWWEGTLNAATGSRFEIVGGKLVVFQTYGPK